MCTQQYYINGRSGTYYLPSSLKSVIITSETVIGEGAFYNCVGLESVSIPSSVTRIERNAFYTCSGLKNLDMPDGVVTIGEGAFQYCSASENISIPATVQNISDSVYGTKSFANCPAIKNLKMPACITSISAAFPDAYRTIESIELVGEFKNIPANMFAGCTSLKSITLPNGVTRVGDYAFSECEGLVSATIPATVTSFGDDVFENCLSLSSVRFLGNAPDVGVDVFWGTPRTMSVEVNGNSIGWNGGVSTDLPASWCDRAIVYAEGTGGGSSGGGSGSGSGSGGSTSTDVDARYELSNTVKDRTIASVTVDSDCAIDEFVLKDGKVFDCVIRVVNTSAQEVKLTLPEGYIYESFKGVKPLRIPANSRNIITITRTADRTFLVSREELETLW